MSKIIFSDIDGTLLTNDHKLLPNTLFSINKLQNNNHELVLISARSPSGIFPILQKYNFNCPIISFNGALILDKNKNILFSKGMNKDIAKEVIDFIEENKFDLSWCIYSFFKWIVKDRNDPRIQREEKIVEANSEKGDINSISKNEIHKILCICSPNEIINIENKLIEKFPNLSIVKSSSILLEIMEKNINKANAINTFCKIMNIDLKDTIAFGDNYNDYEMLNLVNHGFLMDNAPEELKKQFASITSSNEKDGIYNALLKLNLID